MICAKQTFLKVNFGERMARKVSSVRSHEWNFLFRKCHVALWWPYENIGFAQIIVYLYILTMAKGR